VEPNRTSYVLAGFTHRVGFRVFQFDCVENGRARTRHTVEADLSLVRKYGIHVQDLPLLCRRLLDRGTDGDLAPALTFSETEMIACAEESARDHARRGKPWKRRTEAGDAAGAGS